MSTSSLGGRVSRRSRVVDVNVLKSVMHVQSSCFAHKTNCFLSLLLLLLSSSSLLKVPIKNVKEISSASVE